MPNLKLKNDDFLLLKIKIFVYSAAISDYTKMELEIDLECESRREPPSTDVENVQRPTIAVENLVELVGSLYFELSGCRLNGVCVCVCLPFQTGLILSGQLVCELCVCGYYLDYVDYVEYLRGA